MSSVEYLMRLQQCPCPLICSDTKVWRQRSQFELEHLRSNYLSYAIHLNFLAVHLYFVNCCLIDISVIFISLKAKVDQSWNCSWTLPQTHKQSLFFPKVLLFFQPSLLPYTSNFSPSNPFSIDKRLSLFFSPVLLINTSQCQNCRFILILSVMCFESATSEQSGIEQITQRYR